MKHPLHQNEEYPAHVVLFDLAAQEGCDGEPYDQMQEAGEIIKRNNENINQLEACLKRNLVKIDELEATVKGRVTGLEAIVKELTDDIADQCEIDYPLKYRQQYPASFGKKYKRDMEVVVRGRALLKGGG